MRKLIKLTGKIILDRCWYSLNKIKIMYKHIKLISPQLVTNNRFKYYNCGYIQIME